MSIYFGKDGDIFSFFSNIPRTPRSKRGKCGAKTRRRTACQAPPVWDKEKDKAKNGRCKLHGGLSTGPKTERGKGEICASNKRRAKNVGYSLK